MRMTRARQVVAATAMVTLIAGCGFGSDGETTGSAPAGPPASAPSVASVLDETSPTPDETTPAPDETTPPPSPSPSKKKKAPPPVADEPTAEVFWDQLPECAHYDKTTPVAKSKVKAAIRAAAGKTYWNTEAPQLKLNYPLVKAISWQESGWQTNIHNCDGGTGAMQLMPDTVDMVNGRFGLAYDITKYQQNVTAGANYLAWLTKWAGDNYFRGSYDLSAKKCRSSSSWCLLNVVISGYNAGHGGLERAAESRQLPNPAYVASVRSLMARCQCDKY